MNDDAPEPVDVGIDLRLLTPNELTELRKELRVELEREQQIGGRLYAAAFVARLLARMDKERSLRVSPNRTTAPATTSHPRSAQEILDDVAALIEHSRKRSGG